MEIKKRNLVLNPIEDLQLVKGKFYLTKVKVKVVELSIAESEVKVEKVGSFNVEYNQIPIYNVSKNCTLAYNNVTNISFDNLMPVYELEYNEDGSEKYSTNILGYLPVV